jgi:hypothetical protein
MVSPYFHESNVVVGNNITGRARALCWYMEKGFSGFQSITDGCVFELNSVVFNGRRNISGINTVNVHRHYDRDLDYKPLGEETITILSWDSVEIEKDKYELRPKLKRGTEIIPASKSHDWIAENAWIHLQNCFPNIDILHSESTDVYGKPRTGQFTGKPITGQFTFEVKAVYKSGCFHGTANYYLVNPEKPALKMRSYEKTKHQSYQDENLITETLPPSEKFLAQLLKTPHKIERAYPFVKSAILKPKDFRNRYKSFYKQTNLVPGDSFYKSGMLRELSLSQFTFLTFEQYKSWDKEVMRLKNRYQRSYELFFIDGSGTLDYQSLIEAIDKAI